MSRSCWRSASSCARASDRRWADAAPWSARCDRRWRTSDRAAAPGGPPRAGRERLRRRHFVDEMQIDVEQRASIVELADDMSVPQAIEQRPRSAGAGHRTRADVGDSGGFRRHGRRADDRSVRRALLTTASPISVVVAARPPARDRPGAGPCRARRESRSRPGRPRAGAARVWRSSIATEAMAPNGIGAVRPGDVGRRAMDRLVEIDAAADRSPTAACRSSRPAPPPGR